DRRRRVRRGEDAAASIRPGAQGRSAHRAALPGARPDHPRAAGRRHDLVLSAARRHRGGTRRDGLDRAARRRRGRGGAQRGGVNVSGGSRLGLIVNPSAGMGGRVGLKGTDGAEIVRRALELGATPVAPGRAARALARLERCRDSLSVVAGAHAMGGDLARAHDFRTEIVAAGARDETTADDTRAAAADMERRSVELILFAGGDGTTRDIVDAVGTRIPILGIPTGVKMHSGVFATSPEAAGDIAASHLSGDAKRLRETEVMDVDE